MVLDTNVHVTLMGDDGEDDIRWDISEHVVSAIWYISFCCFVNSSISVLNNTKFINGGVTSRIVIAAIVHKTQSIKDCTEFKCMRAIGRAMKYATRPMMHPANIL